MFSMYNIRYKYWFQYKSKLNRCRPPFGIAWHHNDKDHPAWDLPVLSRQVPN